MASKAVSNYFIKCYVDSVECTRLCLLIPILNEDIETLKEENLRLDLENDTISKDYSHLKQGN